MTDYDRMVIQQLAEKTRQQNAGNFRNTSGNVPKWIPRGLRSIFSTSGEVSPEFEQLKKEMDYGPGSSGSQWPRWHHKHPDNLRSGQRNVAPDPLHSDWEQMVDWQEYEQEEISPEQLIQSLKQAEHRRATRPEPSDEELQRVLRLIRERYR
jgi:hypothetical protein